jgi:hypothetical protein
MSQPPLRSGRLLDQLRERIRYAHYSLRTENTYVYWVRYFIRFHNVKHPTEVGANEVEAFLSFLANERKVSPSTHRQALAAILYLYEEVLEIQLLWLDQIGRPKEARANPRPRTSVCSQTFAGAEPGVTCKRRNLLLPVSRPFFADYSNPSAPSTRTESNSQRPRITRTSVEERCLWANCGSSARRPCSDAPLRTTAAGIGCRSS